MAGWWFVSLIQFLSTSWVMARLLGNPTQLFYNEPSLMVLGWFLGPLCCNYPTISVNISYRNSSCCQSSTSLALTSSLSLNTCCSNYWLQVLTVTTTLTSMLSIVGGLDAIEALKLTRLVMNMFCTLVFLGHSLDLCSTLEQIIQGSRTCIFLDLTGWVLVPTTNSINLTVVVGTTNTFFFFLYDKFPLNDQFYHNWYRLMLI
jgi:hypothetical protein